MALVELSPNAPLAGAGPVASDPCDIVGDIFVRDEAGCLTEYLAFGAATAAVLAAEVALFAAIASGNPAAILRQTSRWREPCS